MLTKDKVINLIYYLDDLFAIEYSKLFNIPKDNQYHQLYNGYCFYFAKTLNTLLTSSNICLCNNHYIIKYNNDYFDFRGLIPKDKNGLILFDNTSFSFNKIIVAEDIETEISFAELSGLVDSKRDYVWSIIEPVLLKSANEHLNIKKENIIKKRKF